MLNFKNGTVLQNGNDIEAYLDIVKLSGSYIMVGALDQQQYLFLGNSSSNGNDMIGTARPHLDDGKNIPFLGYDIDFRL